MMMRCASRSAAIILGSLALQTGFAAAAETRSCGSWESVYTAPAYEGEIVSVEFVPAENSQPHPVHFTSKATDGKTLWRHTGIYWCYQGAGGCYISLTYGDKELTEDEGSNRLRVVFVNPRGSTRSDEEAADTLVVAGINSAFFYGQNTNQGLVFKPKPPESNPAFAPEVYHFERCVKSSDDGPEEKKQ